MHFKNYLLETENEFDQKKHIEGAKKWLGTKFGEKFDFKHQPTLEVDDMKSYNASINGKEFIIKGRAFDTNGDGTKDTVLFRINTIDEEPEEKDPEF